MDYDIISLKQIIAYVRMLSFYIEREDLPMRFLLIEDEKHFAEALVVSLKKEGYITDWCANGLEGYEQARSDLYDAIILDWMLPGMDGPTILQHLRAEHINTPVILLTAKSELEDKILGLDCGADDYLCKPFHREELFARLRALTRRKSIQEICSLTFGDLYMIHGQNSLCCSSSGLSLPLHGKEYQLMDFFLHNKEQIISREQIIEKVWGYDSDAEYNNVEVYISFLRKKLLYLKTNVTIKTIRKLGYCLELQK